METSSFLMADDRCRRSAFWSQDWERNLVAPTSALYQGIEAGLSYDEGDEDPGQVAGDTVFTLASERGLDTPQADQLGQAQHMGALADILTFFLRKGEPWVKPEAVEVGETSWEAGVWLDATATRLRRLVLVDNWSENRARSEKHSWRTIGEACVYDMPVVETVLVVGQNRDGRRHSPWSKAWLHPVNQDLRMRKRDGEKFSGKWRPVWREDVDYNRETWIETMVDDGVVTDVVFEVEIPPPSGITRVKVLDLMQRKLAEIRGLKATPDPCPSVCDWPSPCQFVGACWNFTVPSESNGFIQITRAL